MNKSHHSNNEDKKLYSLDTNVANEMLQNILNSCEIESNNISLYKFEIRHKMNYVTAKVGATIALIFFLITLLFPFHIIY